jgi:dUTP pyrophosphatase
MQVQNLGKMVEQLKKDCFEIKIEVLEGGTLPFKKNKTDAGFDLIATSDIKIYPGQVMKHPLNIKMQLPKDTYAQITSKSGLGSKGLLVYAGIIDEEYRGIPHVVGTNVNWKTVVGINESDGEEEVSFFPEAIEIKKGDKLAQLIMEPYSTNYYLTEVETIEVDTARGDGGFGSTGV